MSSPSPLLLQVMGPEALLREKIKQKRHREGYEDGLSSSFK
jgi:AdoMet-dependent rRNA methyltransferase SPB1